MNVLCIMSDTFRRDHLGALGLPAPWERRGHPDEPFIDTPHLDRLVSESASFDRFYIGSYPTVPARYDLFTGRFGFPTQGWQPLDPEDVVLAEMVKSAGYTPAMIFDTPMLGTDSYNFMRGFAGWDFVRGQHGDRYVVDPIETTLPAAGYKLKNIEATHRYLRNTAFRESADDWMCAQTAARTVDWLDRNRSREDFVLWVDMWDPHEPFDAPADDLARYADPAFHGDQVIYPHYGRPEFMNEEERNHVRALYAGLVATVDRSVGAIMTAIDDLGLRKNTMVMFLSDHGHLFGDHDLQGKPTGPLGKLYEVTTRVPLLIRHPEGLGAGERIEGIAQHPDLLPTVLDFLEVEIPGDLHGMSLLPMLRGEDDLGREFAISGRFSRDITAADAKASRPDAASFDGSAGIATPGEPVTLTTREWSYLCPPAGLGPPELYDLLADPGQNHDLYQAQPDMAADLHRLLVEGLRDIGMAPERLRRYEEALETTARIDLVAPETAVYAFTDDRGQVFVYPSQQGAENRTGGSVRDGTLTETTIGYLLQSDPAALVDLHDQYYRVSDLLG